MEIGSLWVGMAPSSKLYNHLHDTSKNKLFILDTSDKILNKQAWLQWKNTSSVIL